MKIGIDLGGTNTVVGLCKDDGTLICKKSMPTRVGDAEQMKADMKKMAIELCTENTVSYDDVVTIGIGVPGTFDKQEAILIKAVNLGMDNVNFHDAFKPEFACDVKLDNDANCAALGEVICGAGDKCKNALMVTLGTGVGGGIVLDGKLYTGFNDIAGEIGHMVVEVDGIQCNCGRKGCFEAYASATGLIRFGKQAAQRYPESILAAKGDKLNAKDVCDACDADDTAAKEAFALYCKYLGCGLANLVNIFQPEIIILGGGVAGYGEKLLNPLREIISRDSFMSHKSNTSLAIASLGNDAGIIGAAMLS